MLRKIIVRNGLWSTISVLFPALFVFIVLPIYHESLSTDDFAKLSLFWTTVSIINSIDFGLATQILISKKEELTRSAALSLWVIGVSQILMMTVYVYVLFKVFSHDEFIFFAIVTLPIYGILNILRVVSEKKGNFRQCAFAASTAAFVSYCFPVFLSIVKIEHLFAWYGVGGIAGIAILSGDLRKIELIRFNLKSIFFLLAKSRPIFLQNLTNILFLRLDRYLVSAFYGAEVYNAYYMLNEFLSRVVMIPSTFLRAFVPLSADKWQQGDTSSAERIFIRNILLLFGVGISSFFIIFGEDLFQSWVHKGFDENLLNLNWLLYIFSIGILFTIQSQLPFVALQSYGQSALILKIYLVEILVYLVIQSIAVNLSIYAVAIAIVIRAFLDFFLLRQGVLRVIADRQSH